MIIRFAANSLQEDQRELRLEEWMAGLNDCEGMLSAVRHAVGCLVSVPRIESVGSQSDDRKVVIPPSSPPEAVMPAAAVAYLHHAAAVERHLRTDEAQYRLYLGSLLAEQQKRKIELATTISEKTARGEDARIESRQTWSNMAAIQNFEHLSRNVTPEAVQQWKRSNPNWDGSKIIASILAGMLRR